MKINPYLKANYLSRLFYCWIDPVVKRGHTKIELEDVYNVLPDDSTDKLSNILEKQWIRELKSNKRGDTSSPSLAKAIIKSFGSYVLLWSVVFIIEEIVRIICPFMIGGLIRYFVNDSSDTLTACMYALGICICAIIPTIIHHPYVMAMLESGMRMRVACSALVYKKMMKLDVSSDKVSIGQIVNILSNDVARFDLTLGLLPYLFVGPLEVLVVSVLLWIYIGWSGICGMLVLLLVIPFMGVLAKLFAKLRSQITVLSGKRLSLMTEILNTIQSIKMFGWESYIEGVLTQTRNEEIKMLYKAGYARGVTLSTSFFSIKIVILVTFLAYVLAGNVISAEIVFVTMSLYNPVKISMTNCFPMAMQFTAETFITIKKIQNFLMLEERDTPTTKYFINQTDTRGSYLNATNLSITRDPNKIPILTNLSFDVKEGDLLMVIGAVGSGKTTLLLTILKELSFLEGELNVSGSVAYVPQTPWIFNDSVRNNILMGSNYYADNYKTVLKFSALEKDLDQLPNGDETIVGERGMSLSGGQKARVGLARALYRNADIYLLDAPLSAVDANVSHFLFHQCIDGFLAKKLRVLVTHQLQYLSHATKILLIDKNQKYVFESYKELVSMGTDFMKIFNESNNTESTDGLETPKSTSTSQTNLKNSSSDEIHERLLSTDDSRRSSDASIAASNHGSIIATRSINAQKDVQKPKAPVESMSSSTIPLKMYAIYLRSGGGILACVLCLLLNILAQSGFLIADWWLAYWCQSVESFMKSHKASRDVECSLNSSCHNNSTHLPSTEIIPLNYPIFPHTNFFIGIFAFLSMLVVLLGVIRAFQFFHMAISSSNNLHTNMLYSVLRSPMTFFVDVPSGQILNRFSKDLGQVDDYLPLQMFDLMQSSFLVLGVFVVISVTNPWVILAIVPMLICFVILRNYFLKTFRNVKRLEAITKSPIFSHVNSTFSGLHTIRCHEVENYFLKEFNILQDNNTATFSLFLFLGRWFAVRLEWLCTVLVCVVAFASIVAQFTSGALIGLSLTYVITLLVTFQWVVRQSTEVQSLMTIVERIHEYSRLPIENFVSFSKPTNWPSKGKIEFKDVTLKYKNEATEALNQINFTINPGEKIGIVGRTGAGKSSLINVLFRLFDFEGEVIIDEISTCSINLHHLRKNLSIIPQDPTLFAGSLRNSLDPLSKHSDEQLWHVLKKVEMDDVLRGMEEGLYFVVREGGSNLSVGQKQLFCMARALLENNKILIIDEATANVDRLTDKLIQKKLRDEFSDCTVLSIAHRLNTIIDCDRIMVLESGKVKEFGIPYCLLQEKNGEFFKLARQSGEAEFRTLYEVAHIAYEDEKKNI